MPSPPSLFLVSWLLLYSFARAQITPNDASGNWPIEVPLGTAARPSGVVAARGTGLFVSTVGGQLWYVDVKAGNATMINSGGDGQGLAGLCADERGDGTLYAGGRESGKLFAFDYSGKLVRIYQLTPKSTDAEPHFIADCIHSRYRLMITDSYQAAYIYFQVPDKGPMAGAPPPIDTSYVHQGYLVQFKGFPSTSPGRLGAFGIEWTGFYNQTAYVMHSSLGQLYAYSVTSTSKTGATMTKVNIEGRRKTFPGALGVLFDSRNERIMYVCMPGANVIAVLEFHNKDQYRAKFIRFITGQLMNGPIMLGEYGQFIYPVSGKFNLPPAKREQATYALTKISRHRQAIPVNSTTDDPFTITYDKQPAAFPKSAIPARKVEIAYLTPPKTTGVRAGVPDEVRNVPASNESSSPSPLPDIGFLGMSNPSSGKSKKRECFPATATVLLMDGTKKFMYQLQIGDSVHVGNDKFSTIFAFTHRDTFTISQFVEVSLSDGRLLRLTPGHLVYRGDSNVLMPASALQVGTPLDGAIVSTLGLVSLRGLYNPQTLDGSIVVDNVRVSTYTSAVSAPVAHALLAPCRAVRPLAYALTFFSHILSL